MPPSRHSSSHHSSSHHSSHSSSHHSSSRSHSSHSYSHSSGRYSSSRSSYSTPVTRTRTSQPYGWNSATHGNTTRYRFANHEYDYYPQSWTAPDGRLFEEGYYDENGQYYANVVASGATTMLRCAYCGNHILYTWKEGPLPNCDKCGAQFQADVTDRMDAGYQGAAPDVRARKAMISSIMVIAGVFLGIRILSAIVLSLSSSGAYQGSRGSEEVVRSQKVSVKNYIYVEEIGRTCHLDGEDWYDSKSECWFTFNDWESPAQWQYWYEGISSDYGDYGWMEYDMDEDAWYIEASEGEWVHLPAGYDTSGLWHMADEYVNAY